jgi:hypothetical protein
VKQRANRLQRDQMNIINANGAPGEGAGRQERQSGRIDTATNNQITHRKQPLRVAVDATEPAETALGAAFRKALASRKAVAS